MRILTALAAAAALGAAMSAPADARALHGDGVETFNSVGNCNQHRRTLMKAAEAIGDEEEYQRIEASRCEYIDWWTVVIQYPY
ncbi:MAG: hypothetical protein ABIT16_04230 [Croceibacterium sp.]